MVYKNTITQ